MCTQVITEDVNILIDPSVSLAPIRFGYPPHSIELKRMNNSWEEILGLSEEAGIIILTHYHFDHFSWEKPSQFKNKLLFIKHPTEKINFSQKSRAKYFLEKIKGLPKQIEYADNKEFQFGKTKIKFSRPAFHGTNNRLGYVIEVLISDDNENFIFTSDVEGPAVKEQTDFILENKPDVIILDAPMTYMLGHHYSYKSLDVAIKNLIRIINETPVKTLILDHHLMRDLKYKEYLAPVFKAGEEKKVKVITAAEFAGKEIEMLEARRKELYQKYPENVSTKGKIIKEDYE